MISCKPRNCKHELTSLLARSNQNHWKAILVSKIGPRTLKIWTGHSGWFLLNSKLFEIAQQKLQHFYKKERYEFSPNFKGVAQKMGLPRPSEDLEVFGGKSKSKTPRAFRFCPKQVPTKVNNWWKFGVDISNHLWDIQNWKFFLLKVPSTRYENNFQKLFYT